MGPEAGGCPQRSGCPEALSPPTLGGMKQDLDIEEVLFHPKYNINGKKAEGIPEFYDYDVALIKLKKKLQFSKTLRSGVWLPEECEVGLEAWGCHVPSVSCLSRRPICLPCTAGTNQALRLPLSTTCQQQSKTCSGREH